MRTRLLAFIAALAISGATQAATVFKATPAPGSKSELELTDEPIIQCPAGTNYAFGKMHDGTPVEGCWVYNARTNVVTFFQLPAYTKTEFPAYVFKRVERPI
ncbi:hypothetical protein [Stenotrophomonas phage BUCTxx99]|nr:hypothetical protein [Stenotrophomonas phage BUCTxx99]